MHRILLPRDQPFSLDQTLGCGQVFRWEKAGGWWTGVVGREVIRVRQEGRLIRFDGTSEGQLRDYLDLDTDIGIILESIDRDPVIHRAAACCAGLRVIHQPPWECLASYICATYAHIPGIRKKIALLSSRFGESLPGPGGAAYHSFPSADALGAALPCDLMSCSLGYRAPYLCETARTIAGDPEWIGRIGSLAYEQAKKDLVRLKGVGPKVADCVLLFAFRKYEAFPVDVWISRIMQRHYGTGEGWGYEKVSRRARDYFGPYAGYAQEYLYGYRRELLP